MNQLIFALVFALVAAYLVMAFLFWTTWLEYLEQEPSISSEDRRLYMLLFVTTTILWPVVVPIAYLELFKKTLKKNNDLDEPEIPHSSSISPLLLSIFISNLLTICGLAVLAYLLAKMFTISSCASVTA